MDRQERDGKCKRIRGQIFITAKENLKDWYEGCPEEKPADSEEMDRELHGGWQEKKERLLSKGHIQRA